MTTPIAPAVIFTTKADAQGKAVFKVNADSVVTVWQSLTITRGIPTATAGVTKIAPNT